MQRFRIAFVASAFVVCITSAFGQTTPRKHINIDDNWKFSFGHAANAEKDFNYSIATIYSKSGGSAKTAADRQFNDKNWRTLDLPHDWAVELPFVNSDDFSVM